MQLLEHLFLTGEFPDRARALSGLTLDQVTLRPDGATHSIYEELWHLATIQHCLVEGDKELEAVLRSGVNYPDAPPDDEQQWHDLVQQFMASGRAIVAWAQEPDRLAAEVAPGETMADELQCMAVHNAYHFGKIVALRQRIGAWPPEAAGGA